jgi:2-dehydro-3-deoxyphosphogluconate aldolase / (4S)-4-hydroxy-2-oxoglutarate aldolase
LCHRRKLVIPTPTFKSRFVPVVEIDDADHAVPLAQALLAGGIDVIEITLRTTAGLGAIGAIAQAKLPIHLGAGTVMSVAQLHQVQRAGASFALSPGCTKALAAEAAKLNFAFVPGVATASEVMTMQEVGFSLAKFFPAVPAGGSAALAAIAGPIPTMNFIPTGGIGASNYAEFLKLPNVRAVGGSWLAPRAMIQAKQWAQITSLARAIENAA